MVIDCGKTFQTRNCRYFDVVVYEPENECDEIVHPHIRVLPGRKAFEDAKVYISKEDPENEDLKKKKGPAPWIENVISAKTPLEALKAYQSTLPERIMSPTHVPGVLAVNALGTMDFRWRPRKEIILRPWQQIIHDEIHPDIPANDRDIIWLYDEDGCSGKRVLARYMVDTYPEHFRVTTDLGTTRDGNTIILNLLRSGWSGHGIFINLVRMCENHDRMYAYIEGLKDAEITTQKFSGNTFVMEPPHIIICANWMPKIKALTPDRWKIRKLKRNKDGEITISKPIKYLKINRS